MRRWSAIRTRFSAGPCITRWSIGWRADCATGCVVLRFNFRGVNLSEGEYGRGIGETEDARTALEELRRRYPDLPALVGIFVRLPCRTEVSCSAVR